MLRALKFESIAVGGLVQFFHLMAHTNPDMDAAHKAHINASLKNLMFFTHQNLLIVIQILLNRMVVNPASGGSSSQVLANGKKTNNYWANSLNQILSQKMVKKVRTKGEAI